MYSEQTNTHLIDYVIILFFVYHPYMFQRQLIILR